MAEKPTYKELEERVHRFAVENQRLRELIQRAPIGIFQSTPEGKYLSLNNRFAEMLGYSPDELVKTPNIADLYVDPAQREEVKRRLAEYDKLEDFPIHLRRKDGEDIWMSIFVQTVRDETGEIKFYDGFTLDITERKRAQQALHDSEEKYRQLFNKGRDAIFILDCHSRRYEDVNEAALDLYGYRKEEFIGLTPLDISAEPEKTADALDRVVEGSLDRVPLRYQMKKDGTVFPVEITTGTFELKGVKKVLGFIRDISERVQAEEERRRLEGQLRQAQKMEAIGTLAGGIAHDFNNVLGIILGNVELAVDDLPKGAPAHISLTEARQGCLRAKEMVKRILAFSRQEEKAFQTIDIQPIVKEALKMLRASIPTTIEIRQEISTKNAFTWGDPTQIHQVLMNLCTNAMDAMDEMGSVLQVRLASIEMDEDAAKELPEMTPGRHIRLSVSDTGHGIAPEVLPKIFDPYFTTKEVGRGTGMGLAVVHGIVKEHGGTVTAYSELGRGTTFHVFFPEAAQELEQPERSTAAPPSGTESVLFVDDEAPLATLGKRMLESLGYQVESQTGSVAALTRFERDPDKYDLVITDMTMPDMTGETLAKELLQIRPDLPVILSTGFSHHMDEEKAESLGIKGFVMKPLVRNELADTVRRVLDRA